MRPISSCCDKRIEEDLGEVRCTVCGRAVPLEEIRELITRLQDWERILLREFPEDSLPAD